MKKIPQSILPIFFQNFDFVRTLEIIKYSKKAQEALNIDIDTYKEVNNLLGENYEKSIINLPSILQKYAYYDLKNIAYRYIISREKCNTYNLNHHILYKNTEKISAFLKYPNKDILICGTKQGEIFLLNIPDRNEIYSNKICSNILHTDKITQIIELKCKNKFDLPPNCIRAVSTSKDKSMKIWNIYENYMEFISEYVMDTQIYCVCEISEKYLAVGTIKVTIVDLTDYDKSYPLDSHHGSVKSLYYLQNEKKLLIGSSALTKVETKNYFVGFNFKENQRNRIFTPAAFKINDILVMDSGDIILCEDDHLKIASFTNNESYLIYGKRDVELNKVIKIDGQPGFVLTCNNKGMIYCFDVINKTLIFEVLTPHKGKIQGISYSVDGDLISYGEDGNVIQYKKINEIIQMKISYKGFSYSQMLGPYKEDKENDSIVIFKGKFENLGEIKTNFEE